MAQVDWDRISEAQYEQTVSILLSRMHPTSRRIDGSGGDGGRDVQFEAADGLHVFQLKSFTGRLDKRRRKQIVDSLKTVAALNPTDWAVIVPIDPTPKELEWFEGLRDTVAFPIEYRGRTWLDAQMSAHPEIGRYVFEDAANEIARLAQELNQERAVLAGGAPDALDRAGAVADQLNGLDPHYRYEITVGEGNREVRIIPRYEGAEVDRPIEGQFRFRFPNDEAGRAAAEAFQRSIDYGVPVQVSEEYVESASLDAPMNLGGQWERIAIEIGPAVAEDVVRTMILTTEEPGGSRLTELAMDFRRTNIGKRGSIWEATDHTGTLTAVLTTNVEEKRITVNLRVRAVETFYPREMVPVMRFLDTFVAPNLVAIYAADGSRISELTESPTERWVEPFMPRLVAGLALLQDRTGMMRRVRPGTTIQQFNDVMTAVELLDGRPIEATWEQLVMVVNDNPLPEGVSIFDDDFPLTLIPNDPHTVLFDGITYPIGRVRVDYRARLGGVARRTQDGVTVDPVSDEWRAASTVPSGTEVVMVPGSTDKAPIRLVGQARIGE
jgi:hypothetical protein